MDYNEILKLSQEALNDPKPGDYWHEMYSWHMYVVDVEETDKVKIITTINASAPCTFPNDGKIEKRTIAEFKAWLSYGSIEGTWAHIGKRNVDISWWEKPNVSQSFFANTLEERTLEERIQYLEKENNTLKERIERVDKFIKDIYVYISTFLSGGK